jgi:hypothetical protein
MAGNDQRRSHACARERDATVALRNDRLTSLHNDCGRVAERATLARLRKRIRPELDVECEVGAHGLGWFPLWESSGVEEHVQAWPKGYGV